MRVRFWSLRWGVLGERFGGRLVELVEEWGLKSGSVYSSFRDFAVRYCCTSLRKAISKHVSFHSIGKPFKAAESRS